MDKNMNREVWGQISTISLAEFEDYMRGEFNKARVEFGVSEREFYKQGALRISLDIGFQPFLGLSNGYNHPNNRIELERILGRFPEVLSKTIICMRRCGKPRRLFLYADGVWVNANPSIIGPTYCVISWSLPRESWLLKKRDLPPFVESRVQRIAS